MYALRLKYFHSETHDKLVVPILVATEANDELEPWTIVPNEDDVYDVACTNSNTLIDAIKQFASNPEDDENFESLHEIWEDGIFKSSPTIIQ